MTIRVDVNADDLAKRLKDAERNATRNIDRTVNRAALLIETAVKAAASGRPGPRAPTGNYRRSINTRKARTPGRGGAAYSIGTTAVQGRRLEYGFMNQTDSLGRTFRQPPYPHFSTGLEQSKDKAVDLIRRELNPFGR